MKPKKAKNIAPPVVNLVHTRKPLYVRPKPKKATKQKVIKVRFEFIFDPVAATKTPKVYWATVRERLMDKLFMRLREWQRDNAKK